MVVVNELRQARAKETLAGDPLRRRLRALGFGSAEAGLLARSVDAHTTGMLARLGHDPQTIRQQRPMVMTALETSCARCPVTRRCRRYLAGGADDPSRFCPGADLLAGLR